MEKIKPYLRYARYIDVTSDYTYNDIAAYDARLIYVESGVGAIVIDGRVYRLQPGVLLVWQPGQTYGFTDVIASPLHILMLNYDFFAEQPETRLITPDPPHLFQTERLDGVFCMIENADEGGVICDERASWAEGMLHELLEEYTMRRIYSDTAAAGLLSLLLTRLCRSVRIGGSLRPTAPESKADAMIAYINSHLSENLSYESLGKIFCYHPNHVNRLITRSTGLPLHRYLTRMRIERAFGLLCDEGRSVAETAELCGFSDATSFARCFRAQTGLSPSEARRQSRR
ncbi:MAG: helix-turn-helix domain-containing protein [Clostridia bacterium]|nr:helix-turn-helix domain-containing protein [Clostridia bacterium]